MPVNLVNASRGKTVRAEPVSALYGYERDGSWHKDQVRHAGEFRELEDQMLNFSTAGYLGDRSPDRVDALVWAFSDLLVEPEPGAAMIEYYRLRANSRVQCSFSRHRTGDRGKSGRVSHHLSSQSWGQQRRECQ